MNVKKIVEIINKEGRQGPKDLKSKEVFGWVTNRLEIDYATYMKVLNENAIPESERDKNRNAFFVIDKKGKYQLLKSKEEEIRKYVCFIIRENPNIISSDAVKRFKLLYQGYTIVDLMDQKNLASKQDIIDQTVRNIMTSNAPRKSNSILFNRTKTKPFQYTLTEEGHKLAAEVDEILAFTKAKELINEEQDSFNDNLEISKGIGIYSEEELAEIFEKNKSYNFYDIYDAEKYKKGRIPTDPKIKNTRFHQTNYCCEIDCTHKTFPTTTSINFLEGHHLVPMALQRNFATINLDCIANMVALCPNCHSQAQYGTREAKKEIFDKIVEKREEDLRSIGFTKEILKAIFEAYY